jgi:HKD family nuclease
LDALNQFEKGKLGDKLQALLEGYGGTEFERFYILSAYAKSSGVERLRKSVEKFRQTGGKVWAVVGVGQKNTSIQALQGLITLCDKAWVYHNRSRMSTFHPKVYAFEKPNQRAFVFIGSGNLTGGGLFTNYEIMAYSEYDLTEPTQAASFGRIKDAFNFYSTPSAFCRELTPELIEEIAADYLSDETKLPPEDEEEGKTDEAKAGGRKESFGAKRVNPPPLPKPEGKPEEPVLKPVSVPLSKFVPEITKAIGCDWSAKGKMRWTKNLTRGDCQLVRGGTAATGRLNLTQAGWKEGGKLIDQTRHFRFNLFKGVGWTKTAGTLETAKVAFCVRVKGMDIGNFGLTLRYDPAWESGQGNYTVGLSWGVLTKLVKDSSLVGRAVSIYDPPAGQREPYFLEVG